MIVLLKPSMVLETTMVVLTIHPLKHPHAPQYVHDNHTTRRLHHVLTIAFVHTML